MLDDQFSQLRMICFFSPYLLVLSYYTINLFWFFLILIILLIFLGVLSYFFALGFVKQNMGDFDDMNSPVNKPLEEYKETIQKGIDFVNSKPHKWIYTTSFDGLKFSRTLR